MSVASAMHPANRRKTISFIENKAGECMNDTLPAASMTMHFYTPRCTDWRVWQHTGASFDRSRTSNGCTPVSDHARIGAAPDLEKPAGDDHPRHRGDLYRWRIPASQDYADDNPLYFNGLAAGDLPRLSQQLRL